MEIPVHSLCRNADGAGVVEVGDRPRCGGVARPGARRHDGVLLEVLCLFAKSLVRFGPHVLMGTAVIILLAVGSDYNLLLVSRFKEEIGAGIKTGIIRAMGSTGSVVTAAGLVFAFTMASMLASDLRNIGQGGTTIGLGLLFDTLIVRSLMTPSIAALFGRWFWWPLKIRPRPAPRQPAPDLSSAPRAAGVDSQSPPAYQT